MNSFQEFLSQPLPFASLVLFLLFTAKFLLSTLTLNNKKLNLPPSPWKLPILGNLHQLGTHPHRTLQSMSKSHGPIFLLQLGSTPTLIASSADSAREIMKTHDLVFSNRPYTTISNRLLYNYKDLSQAPYGEYWRQMRSICVLRLLSPKRVESFRHIREQEAALLVDRIEKRTGSPLNLGELISKITTDVVCRVAFGRKYGDDGEGEEGKKFKRLLEEFGSALGTVNVADFIPWLGWMNWLNGLNRKVEKVFNEFDEFLDQVVEDHYHPTEEKSEDEKDLVDVLLQIQRESTTPNSAIDRDTIKAIVLDMFAAGSDTTYTALEWTMTEILRHPRVMEKLQREIRESKRNVKEEDIERMEYLKAVIKESFRLHPPVPLLVPRESTKDVRVLGYDVAEKTRVIVNAWAIGRDPKRWEDAEEFRPERFIGSRVDFKGHDFELIPFGAGRRGCPGTGFAVASMEITLVSMLHRFDWSVVGDGGMDADEAPGLAVHRKTPLVAVPTLHSP